MISHQLLKGSVLSFLVFILACNLVVAQEPMQKLERDFIAKIKKGNYTQLYQMLSQADRKAISLEKFIDKSKKQDSSFSGFRRYRPLLVDEYYEEKGNVVYHREVYQYVDFKKKFDGVYYY